MLKWLVRTLAVAGCACALGCGVAEGSSEGLVRQLVRCAPQGNATPEKIQKFEDDFRDLPSKCPIIQRFEWGKTNVKIPGRDSHYLLVTINDHKSLKDAAGQEYRKALDEVAGRYMTVVPWAVYYARDETPHARTATRGHLRRVETFDLKKGIAAEEIQMLEDEMGALPAKIPAIERLEWGPSIGRAGRYFLLLTFKNASTRDAYLSHPAYKEFEKMLEQYVTNDPFDLEYVARD